MDALSPRRRFGALLLAAAALAAAPRADAQSPLRSPHLSLYPQTNFYDFKVAHLNGDAAPDLLFSTLVDGIQEADGDGLGGIAPTSTVAVPDSLSVAVGDLDGDGLDDCAFLPFSGSFVVVRLNFGSGAWGPGPTLDTYTAPGALAIADLDLDGRLDVLAAGHHELRVQWFRNLGSAQFAAPVDVECAVDALALAVGDVDGNGWPDLASASSVLGDSSVVATRSDGAGGFLPGDTLGDTFGLQPGDTLTLGDVDDDGVNDVLLAAGTQGLAVFRGTQGEKPRPPVFFPTPLPAQSLGTGDLDGDGDADVSVGQHGGLVTNFLAQGSAMALTRNFAAAVGPVFEQVTDFDLDGSLDVITGNGQVLTPLMGRGHGDFRPCYGFAAPSLDLAVGDHDGDGFPDAVVVLGDGSGHLLPGVPGSCLGREHPVDVGPAPLRVFFASANSDEAPDLVALQSGGGQDGVAVMLGDGQEGFGPPLLVPVAATVKGGTVGDLNLDHVADVIALRNFGTDNSAIVLMNAGDGTLSPSAVLVLSQRPLDAQIANMNGDGLPDFVLLEDARLDVFLGDGAGHFGAPQVVSTLNNGLDLVVRDFDDDGYQDVIVARQLDADVQIFYGNGDGTLQPVLKEDVRVKPTGLDAGDLDGDGGLDLMVTGLVDVTLPGSVAVLPSQHVGGFGNVTLAASSDDAGKPVITDLDQDGHPDAALLIPKGNQLDLYVNVEATWSPLGHSLAGSAGYSGLLGVGSLQADTTLRVIATGTAPLAPLVLVAGFDALLLPFKGGVLVPAPIVLLTGLSSSVDGALDLSGPWPAGVPAGTTLVLQAWLVDAGGPQGFSATTALQALTP